MSRTVQMMFLDHWRTQFMQQFDVFESFKVIILPIQEATVVDDYGERHIMALQKLAKDHGYGLVAIYDKEKVYYRNPDVRVVSNGRHFWLLDDILPGEPCCVNDAMVDADVCLPFLHLLTVPIHNQWLIQWLAQQKPVI